MGNDVFEPLAAPEKPKRTRKPKADPLAVTEEQISEALEPVLRDFMGDEELKFIFGQLLEACKTKRLYMTPRGYKCVKCGCPHVHRVEVTDLPTAIKAMELVLNRVYGRPGQAAGEDSGVVVKLVTVAAPEK